MNRYEIDRAVDAYVETALWSSVDDDGMSLDSNYGADDLAPETLATMRADVIAFVEGVEDAQDDEGWPGLVGISPEVVGADFWLTRNRHGAGFWDRGLGAQGDYLTDVSHGYGACVLYAGHDGRLHIA